MLMTKILTTLALLPALLLAAAPEARADAGLQALLEQALATAHDKHHLPGIAALVQVDGKVEAEAALGLRAAGHPEPVTTTDRWHLGSDTKAFTATLLVRLADRGMLSLDEPLPQALPALAGGMNAGYRAVTVRQLLSHTAGLPPLTDDADLPPFTAAIRSADGVKMQRLAVARLYLGQPPASPAGGFAYSNAGYIIAGAVAEARTGKTWETLIHEEIFAPLGITQAGFGPPGADKPKSITQPRGHRQADGAIQPVDPAAADDANPPALGPAGTIHMSLRDWARFAQDQLDGVNGKGRLMSAAAYRQLHTAVTDNYALGWGVVSDAEGRPLLLTHTGSNGDWIADVRIMPRSQAIVLLAMNLGDEGANQAVVEIGKPLRDRLARATAP